MAMFTLRLRAAMRASICLLYTSFPSSLLLQFFFQLLPRAPEPLIHSVLASVSYTHLDVYKRQAQDRKTIKKPQERESYEYEHSWQKDS